MPLIRIGALWLYASLLAAAAAAQPAQKVIFDTDFAFPPQDDSLALFFVLNSPDINLLGITTVAGNRSLNVATADVLKILEAVGRTEIPVYEGAAAPLMHVGTDWDSRTHGGWYSNPPAREPPGGFATSKRAERQSAVDYLVQTVRAHPREVTILAIGPLTNIAMAMRTDTTFASNVKQLVIMGGAIAALPDGAGNHTPNAEFNIYVDPEAAQIVLRSGMPILLSPLNVSRKARFTKQWLDRIIAVDTPITRLIREHLGPLYEARPDRVMLMYDQVAAVSLVAPSVAKTEELLVDVDVNLGPSYGVTVGGRERWPGGEQAHPMQVQTDLDWDRFIQLFVERVTARPAAMRRQP